MNGKFLSGFFLMFLAFIVINLITGHLQSDCGIRAVIGLWLPNFRLCADDIVRVGFPLRVLEEGGFAFRSVFSFGALVADILIALVASLAAGLVVARRWK